MAVESSLMKVWAVVEIGGRGEAVGAGKGIVWLLVGVLRADGDGEQMKVSEVVIA